MTQMTLWLTSDRSTEVVGEVYAAWRAAGGSVSLGPTSQDNPLLLHAACSPRVPGTFGHGLGTGLLRIGG
jgi:hypothetical protein